MATWDTYSYYARDAGAGLGRGAQALAASFVVPGNPQPSWTPELAPGSLAKHEYGSQVASLENFSVVGFMPGLPKKTKLTWPNDRQEDQ